MTQVISIIGKAKSGKTTLLEKLIKELSIRGYRIGTIKHTRHEGQLDAPEKDTWRHIKAGSLATALSTPNGILFIKPMSIEPGLEEVTRLFGDEMDLIITEGFKYSNTPKIEVHRRENGPPLEGIPYLKAIATDEKLETDLVQLPLNDTSVIADFIEQEFLSSAGKSPRPA
jgi:molybdopterin-guanine dinucleotide biosynthesis protein MobB